MFRLYVTVSIHSPFLHQCFPHHQSVNSLTPCFDTSPDFPHLLHSIFTKNVMCCNKVQCILLCSNELSWSSFKHIKIHTSPIASLQCPLHIFINNKVSILLIVTLFDECNSDLVYKFGRTWQCLDVYLPRSASIVA